MPRTLESVVRVMGPFLGVNEAVTGDIQPPQYAETMKNLVLNRGMIEARPGLRNVLEVDDSDTPEDALLPWINAIAVLPQSFKEFRAARDPTDPPIPTGRYTSNGRLLIVTSERELPNSQSTLYLTKSYERPVYPYLTIGRAPKLSRDARGDIVHLGDKSFLTFADWDRPHVVKWLREANPHAFLPNGVDVNAAGFDLPSDVFTVEPTGEPNDALEFPPGRYAFAITFYDGSNGTESNGNYVFAHSHFIDVVSQSKLRFTVFFGNSSEHPNTARITRLRLYAIIERLDEDPDAEFAGGETAYRLIAEVDVSPSAAFEFLDIGREELRIPPIVPAAEALSGQGVGPYIPTRNGTPPKSNALVVYDNKVCYASVDPDSYGALFYSADFNGEHVAADAFISFDDEGSEPIAGLKVYQGRLLVYKETGIYVIAGTLTQMSNDDVALGNPAPQPLFSKYKVEGVVGCYNKNGGSLAIKECDGILYYNVLDGIYGFDGLRSRKVSDPIKKTHALVSEDSRGNCSMANDRRTGLLWIHYAQVDDKVFCFDYRKGVGDPSVGNWTIHQFPSAVNLIADVPPAECPVLSSDPLILAGTGDEPARLLEMLEAYRGIDHTIGGDDQYFSWEYATPWMSLGLLDRPKRVHTVTLFYGPGASETFYFSVDVEQERGRTIKSRTFQDDYRIVRSRPVSHVLASGKPYGKFAINKRGTRIRLFFSADLTRKCIGPFTGFAIDAEPVGRR